MRPLMALLGQLSELLERMDDRRYRTETAAGVSGSVGGHVRHCLDHVASLVAGCSASRMSYDARLRGTSVETRREAALAEIGRLSQLLGAIPEDSLNRPLDLAASLDSGGAEIVAASSVGRELAFVVSHTVHHFAVIALLLRDTGIALPPRFGYAPTTPTTTANAA